MNLRFRWNDEEGCAVIDPKSLESIQEEFQHSPLSVLDFLLDVHVAVVEEYNDALNGFYSMADDIMTKKCAPKGKSRGGKKK